MRNFLKEVKQLEKEVSSLQDEIKDLKLSIDMVYNEVFSHHCLHQISLRKQIHMVMDYFKLTYDIPEKQEIKLKLREEND